MKGLTAILPLLDEDFYVLRKTILSIISTSEELGFSIEIIIADGGSKKDLIKRVKHFCKYFQGEKIRMKYIMDYPMIKPNKNIGILNAYHSSTFEDILIVDSDNTNLTSEKLKEMIDSLEDYSLVIPDLQRTGGRSNRLLGNPPMRLFFPEIYEKIPYPYPGILAIKKEILGKIISEEYCFDWGGEAQIAVQGYLNSNGKVKSFYLDKIDAKKRPIKSMTKDSFQIYRTNILLAIKNNRFPENLQDLDLLVTKDIETHKEDAERLKNYLKDIKISELVEDSLFGLYKLWGEKYKDNPLGIYEAINLIQQQYSSQELKILNSLVTKPLLQILFDIEVKEDYLKMGEDEIRNLEMRKISFLADIVIAAILNIYLHQESKKPFTNLRTMLQNSPNDYSEFNSLDCNDFLEGGFLKGINLLELNEVSLERLVNTIKIDDTRERNQKIKSLIDEDTVGKIQNEKIKLGNIGWRTENIEIDNDLFVNLSVLTTISGYLKCNEFSINSKEYRKKDLEVFLSYVLNNKKFAPIEYNLDLSFSGKTTNRKIPKHDYDCVILFSGGIDSTAAFLTALDKKMKPLLLWVGFGQKNEAEEYEKIKKIAKKINYPVSIIRVDLKEYIEKGWEEWDYIIPARNFMFVAFAASFLSNSIKDKTKIYLSAHEEEIKETNTDKSERFFKTCTDLFSDFYNKEIVVDTPFREKTKTELLATWKNNWFEKYGVSPHDTVTCYYGDNCGKCKACLKRTIALLAAGWDADQDIKINPMEDKENFLKEDILPRFEEFSEKRKMETLIAIERAWDSVPLCIKERYNTIHPNFVEEIRRYKSKLNEKENER